MSGGEYRTYYLNAFVWGDDHGFATIDLEVKSGNFKQDFKQNITSYLVDVLIINDYNGYNTLPYFLRPLKKTDLTYGFYDPLFGSTDFETFADIKTIIWNATTLYPAVSHAELNQLASLVNMHGSDLLVTGQFIAEILTDTERFAYANEQTKGFLNNVLKAEFRKITSGEPNNPRLKGSCFASGLEFGLRSAPPYQDLHWNTNSINSLSGATVLFNRLINSHPGSIQAVHSTHGMGRTVFLDFSYHSIDTEFNRDVLLRWTLRHFDYVVSNDNPTIIKPSRPMINVFPNPVRNTLNIDFMAPSYSGTPSFSIYNIRGQRIHSSELSTSESGYSKTIDFSNLSIPSGMYFIKVSDSTYEGVKRVIVIR